MNGNGCKLILLAISVILSFPSVARVLTDTADKTPECMKQVDWKGDAYRNADSTEEIFIKAEGFDKLVACAYSTAEFERGLAIQLRPGPPTADEAKVDELQGKYRAYSSLIRTAALEKGDSQPVTDLLIGKGTEGIPTAFVRANYYEGTSFKSPVAKIVRDGISYMRSPEYPGFCDDLKGNPARYEWCTGARGASANDPRTMGCKDQYCDISGDGSAR